MNSHLFMPELVPPPEAYAAFTVRRAIWTELGQNIDDMPARELQQTILYMRAEREHAKRRSAS